MFSRTEGNFGQTGSIRRHLARFEHSYRCWKLSVVACLSSFCHELRRIPLRSPPSARTATKFSKSKRVRTWRHPVNIKVAPFQAQYNHGMADRIACSCVTCPQCGTWVVLTLPTALRSDKEKFRAGCPVPECGKEFEFEASETHVFELPLPLFERRHFFRSELR